MIQRSEALVLRVSPFSGTSHVVTWFTKSHGRIATVIKGASRPKSRFLGQYDLFYTCELLFYARSRNGVHIAKECAPLAVRIQLRSDWRATAAASYVCDLILRLTMEGDARPGLYKLAESALDFMCAHGSSAALLLWYELKLLGALGVGPQLDACPVCGRRVEERDSGSALLHRRMFFSHRSGGVLCSNCESGSHRDTSVSLSPDVLKVLQLWEAAGNFLQVRHITCTPGQLLEFRRILGIFGDYHLHIAPASRRIALDMNMAGRPGAGGG